MKALDVDSVLREWFPAWTQVESQATIWDSLGPFGVLCAIIVAIATAAVVWRKRVSTKYWVLVVFSLAGVCNIVNFYPGPISLAAMVLVWLLGSHRNPPLQPLPKLKRNEIHGHDGFRFFRFGKHGILERSFPEWLRSARNESGLLWEGFGVGISRTTGKVEAIAVWLYGSNGGVGHYHYRVRANTFESSYGDGHFSLITYEQKSKDWEFRVLEDAAKRISVDVSRGNRPLTVTYDPESGAISMYDPESGRDVYINKNRPSPLNDLFVFGPYPKKLDGVPRKEPGVAISPTDTIPGAGGGFFVSAQDVYGHPLKHVEVSFQTESGYRYLQVLGREEIFVNLPAGIEKIRVLFRRRGYGELSAEVDITRGSGRIEAVLEPLREEE